MILTAPVSSPLGALTAASWHGALKELNPACTVWYDCVLSHASTGKASLRHHRHKRSPVYLSEWPVCLLMGSVALVRSSFVRSHFRQARLSKVCPVTLAVTVPCRDKM